MADRSTRRLFPPVDFAARAACFEEAWLKQLDVNAALERRLSRASGLPPSSDGLRKPPVEKRTRSRRGKSACRSGGPQGRNAATDIGAGPCDKPLPEICNGCGADLVVGMAKRSVARQVVDPPPEVTGHRAHPWRCSRCDAVTRAPFPEGVTGPVQYGPRISAVASDLQTHHCLPKDRLALLLSDLFGRKAVPATLAGLSDAQQIVCNPSRKLCVKGWGTPQAGVVHPDETGLRVEGRTRWLHVICSPLLSHLRVSPRRRICVGKARQKVSGGLPIHAGCRSILHPAYRDMHRPKAGVVNHRNIDESGRSVDRRIAPRIDKLKTDHTFKRAGQLHKPKNERASSCL